MKTLYMFIDEAGDYNFRPKGSKYLIWGAMTIIENPHLLYTPFSQLKQELNTNGIDMDRFHASEDRQWVRNKVFNTLNNPRIPFENDFVIVEKRKTNLSIRDPVILYPKMAYYLLQYIFNRHNITNNLYRYLTYKEKEESGRKSIERKHKTFVR